MSNYQKLTITIITSKLKQLVIIMTYNIKLDGFSIHEVVLNEIIEYENVNLAG